MVEEFVDPRPLGLVFMCIDVLIPDVSWRFVGEYGGQCNLPLVFFSLRLSLSLLEDALIFLPLPHQLLMVDAQNHHLLLVPLYLLGMSLDVPEQPLLLLEQALLLATAFFKSEVVLYVLLDAGDLLVELGDRWNNSVEFGVAIRCDEEG